MRSLPPRLWAVIGGVVVFAIIILSVLAWAAFSGAAGSQRGLTVRSTLSEDAVIVFANGQSATLGPGRRQRTFVVKREEYPSTVTVRTPEGETLFERRFEYAYFVDAEFRISFDAAGFFRTQDYRATPTPAAEEAS